jgi:hypothetical protein
VSLCCWTQCERPRCRCHKMSFLTIRSLSERPRRWLVLGRDGELGAISPNEIDDLLEQMTARIEASTSKSVFATIKADYDQISRAYFPKSYFFPEGMSFARSDALFPQPALASVVGPEYEAQCRMLCYGSYPSWDNVQNRFLEMRNIL